MADMKRILKWVAIALAGCVALLLVSGVVWEQIERRQVALEYPAPGRLIDIDGGRRIQIDCRGTGTPTVVFENGLDYFGSLAWGNVLAPVAKFTRACAYSRAGMLWSDGKPGLHDGLGVAHDLHATLAAAGEKGPYVMVGHSLGGPYISIFTGLYGDQVAGLVYVDASHPDQLKRNEAALGKKLKNGKALVQKLGAQLSWTGITRLMLGSLPPNSEMMSRMAPRAAQISWAFLPISLGAVVSEREAMASSRTFDEAQAYRNLGARPVIVLTRGKPIKEDGMSDEEAGKLYQVWLEMQKDMTTWSSRGTQRVISDSGHYVANDDPGAVIAAVREVVDDVRSAN